MTTKKTKTKKPATPATPPIKQQPQSNQQAAKSAGITLHTDDTWSNAYWTNGDLHCEERELFG